MDDRGLIYQGARNRLIARLEEAEADVEFLLEKLHAIAEASVVTGHPFDEIGTRFDELVGRLPAMKQALSDSDELDRDAAEPIDRLSRVLTKARQRADILDGSSPPPDVPTMRVAAEDTVAQLTEARKAILQLVIPARLRRQLHGLRIGQSVDFKEDYERYLPETDERKKALKAFAARNDYFQEAVFDIPGERVWRRSGSKAWRIATCAAPVAFAGLVAGLFALIGAFDWPNQYNLDDTSALLAGYALVLLGVVAQLIVENVKQAQAKTVPILAIGEAVDWLHLRWAGLALSFLPIIAVVIGLRAIGTEVAGEEALVFLFAGYSVDSVAGTFLTRFGTAAGAGATNVLRRVGGGPAP